MGHNFIFSLKQNVAKLKKTTMKSSKRGKKTILKRIIVIQVN